MEQSAAFDLDLALHHYVDTLNSHGILSQEDQDELLDHLHLEIQALQSVGLTTEEAFVISKKRLGHTELIQSEYRKVKPWFKIVQLLIPAFMLVFVFKSILNFASITAHSSTILISKYTFINLGQYLKWGDWSLQTICIVFSLFVGAFILRKLGTSKLQALWPIPVLFLISEILKTAILPISTAILSPAIVSSIYYHGVFVNYGMLIVGFIFFSGLMIRHRNLEIQVN